MRWKTIYVIKWAIRKVSVGVVSAAIASGIFIVVGGGEAHASDKQLDKDPVVETVKPQVDENVVAKPTEKAESDNEELRER